MELSKSSDSEILSPNFRVHRPFPIRTIKENRSLSPNLEKNKSSDKLPPIWLKVSSSSLRNITPQPRVSPVKLEPVKHISHRIKTVIKKSLFPSPLLRKIHLPRAPSVNDLEPAVQKTTSFSSITCRKCKSLSSIIENLHLQEFKTWGLCSNCQNDIFHTSFSIENYGIITFKNTGDFSEFSLDAQICFWLEGNLWSSVSEYIQGFEGKPNIIKAITQKVKQHPRLEDLLKKTKDNELIYLNSKNTYWGVGFNGLGTNELGKILMEIRRAL